MNLVPWTPKQSGLISDRDFDQLFNWAFGTPAKGSVTTSRSFMPAIDFVEEKDRYVIHVDLPGLSKDEIDLSFQDGVLSIRGERKDSKAETTEEEGTKVLRRERIFGTFERRVRLPENVDASKISARFENGVLALEVPFLPEAQPVKLQIQ